MLLADIVRQNAMKLPNKTALVFRDTRLTYVELNRQVNRMANALLGIGGEKGNRVAVLADNCPQFVELYFAVPKAGMIIVPLNTALDSDGLSYIINDSGANVIIFSENYLDIVNSLRSGLKTVKNYIVIGKAAGVESYEGLVSKYSPDEPEVVADEDDTAWLMYTSGTTGSPKGVMLSHKNLLSTMVNQILSCYPLNRNDVNLTILPVFWLGGICYIGCYFYVGSTDVLLERADPRLVLEAIERERATTTFAVPPIIVPIVNHPDIDKYNVSSVRIIVNGGAPMPEGLQRKAIEVFGDIFVPMYGLTEAALVMATPLLEGPWEKVKRPGSCGKEATGAEVRVVNEEGEDVGRGEVGEILVRGDNVMKGYWNMPEATAKTLEGGWLHTGDLATKDEEGYYYITGRKKDTITSAGKAIYSPEIEDMISLHPSIAEVAVIGVPNVNLGEAVKAVVVLKAGKEATEQEIIEWCANQLEDYKLPKSIDIVDSLPKTPTGKLRKTALRDRYTKG